MRTKLIAGNWKMNKDVSETETLLHELIQHMKGISPAAGVVVCPPFTSLAIAHSLIRNTPIKLGAQDMSEQDDGAFTGEISARMLRSTGAEYVILGHSERRQYHHETDDLVNKKIIKALAAGLTPIACVGETLQERESGVTDAVITRQIKGVLAGLAPGQMVKIVIAYEPVWAIGTGKTATPEQANQVHKLIRSLVGQMYAGQIAENLIIQYGGSVNAGNASNLLSQPDIDGSLVGGASLKVDSFLTIINAVQ